MSKKTGKKKRFVRVSKYRHVFGHEYPRDEIYEELRVSRSAWDTNIASVNPNYLSINIDAGGGGAFAVLPFSQVGKQPSSLPLYAGHQGTVLDTAFHPFNDQIIASASEDTTTKIWAIPPEGLTENQVDPLVTLSGHMRKVGGLSWNPIANAVLATSSTDYTVRVWDVHKGAEQCQITGFEDTMSTMSWNEQGNQMAVSCKDKMLRVADVRANAFAHETQAHEGVKGFRAVWLTGKDKLFTVGFSKRSQRQFNIFDLRKMESPIAHLDIDSSAGQIMPFWDEDTGVMYLAGKGDGNIRYYELVNKKPYFYLLSEFKSSAPQRGMAMMPKRGVDTSVCEVTRLFKVTTRAVTPISFRVPRKSDLFQEDIYPATAGGDPALTADQWFAGGDAEITKVSLADGPIPAATPWEGSGEVADAPTGPVTLSQYKTAYAEAQARIAELEAQLAAAQA